MGREGKGRGKGEGRERKREREGGGGGEGGRRTMIKLRYMRASDFSNSRKPNNSWSNLSKSSVVMLFLLLKCGCEKKKNDLKNNKTTTINFLKKKNLFLAQPSSQHHPSHFPFASPTFASIELSCWY